MPSSPGFKPPTAADIAAAARRLKGRAVETPLLESPVLNQRFGGRLLFKAECLQLTGSFKFRGAFNRVSRLSPAERRAGVVAPSSGNHAQGVAAAAQQLGVPAVIVMPKDAPAVKVEGTRFWGAEIVFYDRAREDRDRCARTLAKERGATLIPPYNHPEIVAGQGTVGREIARAARARGLVLDAALVPCGGGGLVAGCAIALQAERRETAVYAVEPAGWDETRRSLEAGRRIALTGPHAPSLCDALLSIAPGEFTFPINRRRLAGGLAADDAAVRAAMALAFRHLKLVVEPGGAVALAALVSGAFEPRGRTIAVVLSGGNVEARLFARAIRESNEDSGKPRRRRR